LRGKINIKENVDINEITVQSEHTSRIFRDNVRGRCDDQLFDRAPKLISEFSINRESLFLFCPVIARSRCRDNAANDLPDSPVINSKAPLPINIPRNARHSQTTDRPSFLSRISFYRNVSLTYPNIIIKIPFSIASVTSARSNIRYFDPCIAYSRMKPFER